MTYEIRKQTPYTYMVFDTITNTVIGEGLELYAANELSWQEMNPAKRYQILANSFANRNELTWYYEHNGIVTTNGYATIEDARLDIVEDMQALCVNNDYAVHPNPRGDHSIMDTFTGEEVFYEINDDEARHPDPDSLEQD